MKAIFILLALSFSVYLQAQNIDFKKKNFDSEEQFNQAVEALEKGDDFFFAGNFEKALPRLREAQKLNPNNALLNFKIGACYLKIDELEKSMPYFETAKKLDPKVDPKIDYALAQSYQANGEFDKAVESYQIYLGGLSKNKKILEEPKVQKDIDICSTEIQKKQTKIEEEKEAVVKEEKEELAVAEVKKEEPATKVEEVKKETVAVKVIEPKKEEARVAEVKIANKTVAPVKGVTQAKTSPNKLTYRIQISSMSTLATSDDIKKVYSGNLKVTHQKIGSLYKYYIGDFNSKLDAMKAKSESGVAGAFIVKFLNGKKM